MLNIVFLSNDLTAEPGSLSDTIDHLDNDRLVTASELIYLSNSKRICSVDGYRTEH